MMRRYVAAYMNKLTKEDMIEALKKENIVLNRQEEEFAFAYIKKNWNLIFDNQEKIFSDLKQNLTSTTYQKIEPILLFYQKKYKCYL